MRISRSASWAVKSMGLRAVVVSRLHGAAGTTGAGTTGSGTTATETTGAEISGAGATCAVAAEGCKISGMGLVRAELLSQCPGPYSRRGSTRSVEQLRRAHSLASRRARGGGALIAVGVLTTGSKRLS